MAVAIDQVIVDSGNTGTLGLPAAAMAALHDSMHAWFQTSSLQIRTRACNTGDRQVEEIRDADPGGYTCAMFFQSLGCTDDVAWACPVTCHTCEGAEGDTCTTSSDCGGGFFCSRGACDVCGDASVSVLECQRLPSLAAELALSLFSPESDGCDNAAGHYAGVSLDDFPTIALDFAGFVLELPPASYLEVNSGSNICRTVEEYGSGSETQAMLGAGMLQHYYALFEMPSPSGAGGQLGLATRGDCTPGTDDAESSPETYCRARGDSCSQCAGPVDDLTQHRGYCVWCPATSTCTAADPKSMVSPCPNAMGFSAHSLDNAQGGRCPDLTTAQIGCQIKYA